jgi:hypothetical protein
MPCRRVQKRALEIIKIKLNLFQPSILGSLVHQHARKGVMVESRIHLKKRLFWYRCFTQFDPVERLFQSSYLAPESLKIFFLKRLTGWHFLL